MTEQALVSDINDSLYFKNDEFDPNAKGKESMELLKRRGQEYFTLVLTKNYSNLVAALSYCSDEGN